MKKQHILTEKQRLFLEIFAANKSFADKFYLTGGTALAEYYIPYRYSEDLDFFSEDEIDVNSAVVFFKSKKKLLGYKSFELNTSFNRNMFFLNFNEYVLKIEFTYFPFPQIEKPKIARNIKIDSILDIAVNKLFTIYQKPRSRDFMDLYMIQIKYKYPIRKLLSQARIKFDVDIDPLKLGSQFLLSEELKDYPRLLISLKESDWQDYFEEEAKNLGKKIISSR